jgi:hypothetical protein
MKEYYPSYRAPSSLRVANPNPVRTGFWNNSMKSSSCFSFWQHVCCVIHSVELGRDRKAPDKMTISAVCASGVYRLWRNSGYAIGALTVGLWAGAFGGLTAIAAIRVLSFLSCVIVGAAMRETLWSKSNALHWSDIVQNLASSSRAGRNRHWACYHTSSYDFAYEAMEGWPSLP